MSARKKTVPVFLFDLAADILAVTAAYFAAFFLRFRGPFGAWLTSAAETLRLDTPPVGFTDYAAFYLNPVNAFRIILLLALVLCTLNAFFNLYSGRRFIRPDAVAFNLLKSGALALLLLLTYLYLSRNRFHPRSTFLILMGLQVLFAALFRSALAFVLARLRRARGWDLHPVLLAGEAGPLDHLEAYLADFAPHGLTPLPRLPGPPLDPARLPTEAERRGADMLLLAERRLGLPALLDLLRAADARGITLKIWSDRFDVLINQARIECDTFLGVPLIHFSPAGEFMAVRRLRRLGSLLLALLVLSLGAPVLLLIAALIRLTSPGPALFIQDRIGQNGRVFRMFKFRTMREGAEEQKEPLARQEKMPLGPLFKLRRDPRVTPLGRFLRKFSLDELPQFLNVLTGDMNVVGPRPLPVEECGDDLADWHRGRQAGMPGITGLWQVSGRSDLDFEQMCLLDVYYLHNASLTLDTRILFRTVVSAVFARGAY